MDRGVRVCVGAVSGGWNSLLALAEGADAIQLWLIVAGSISVNDAGYGRHARCPLTIPEGYPMNDDDIQRKSQLDTRETNQRRWPGNFKGLLWLSRFKQNPQTCNGKSYVQSHPPAAT